MGGRESRRISGPGATDFSNGKAEWPERMLGQLLHPPSPRQMKGEKAYDSE